jgi:hypothetical protein
MLQSHLKVGAHGLSPVVLCLCSFPTLGSSLSPTCWWPSCHLFTDGLCELVSLSCPSPLFWWAFSNPYPLFCVLVFSSVVYSVFFFFAGEGSVCAGGLCSFIPGVTEGYCMMLVSHLFGLPKVRDVEVAAHLFCQCIVVWRSLPGLGVQGATVLTLLGASPPPSEAPASQQGPWFTELTLSASVTQLPFWICTTLL